MRRVALRALDRGLLRPPVGPSCSRWISCTCCAAQAAPQRPPRPPERPPNIPPLGTLQHMQTHPHQLPLPPPLPWSPDSQPFLRHMQILSLALLSPGADSSWSIYQALHPDLHAAIPDDVFASLLVHQLSADKAVKRERVLELVDLARKCGMDPATFTAGTLKELVRSLLSAAPHDPAWPAAYPSLDWLWNALVVAVNRDLRRVPLKIRQDWLAAMTYRHRTDLEQTHAALEHLVGLGGGQGITQVASRILLRSKNHDADTIAVSLRLAAWCLARGVNIEGSTLRRIVSRLKAATDALGDDGRSRTQSAAEGLIAELREGGADRPALAIQLALLDFNKANRTAIEKGAAIAEDPSATAQQLLFAVTRIVKGEPGEKEREAALRLCMRALQTDGDIAPILELTLKHVAAQPQLVLQLAQACLHANVFATPLPRPWVTKLFNAVLQALPSPAAFDVAVRLYPHVRASAEGQQHKWLAGTARPWEQLFRECLARGRLQLASRLYADMKADGLYVSRGAQLAFIKAIASKRNDSRSVLLDRHVKDYLWDEAQPVDQLVVAIAQGLAKAGSSDDAAMAARICQSIVSGANQSGEIPSAAAEPLMVPLFTSARRELRQLGFSTLQMVPTAQAERAYKLALGALAKNAQAAGLGQVVEVYRNMESRGVPSSGSVASSLIVTLLKTGHLDSAYAVFGAATDNAAAIKSFALGRLMVNLALAGRCDDAYDAERRWRALFPAGADYAKGVYGARLVVDFKAGKDVDMTPFTQHDDARAVLKDHEGYKPTRHFYNFIESLRPQPEPVPAAAYTPAEVAAERVRPRGGSKQQVQPITRSWYGSGEDAGWRLDTERRRGVDMSGSGGFAPEHSIIA